MINPYWELIILLALINVIFTLSLNLILGYNGQFALGHAGFLLIGAYASGVATSELGWPLWAGILLAIALAAAAAAIVGYPSLRLRGDYLAIATLGFAEIIRIVTLTLPPDMFGGPTGKRDVLKLNEYIALPQSMNGVGNLFFTVLFALLFVGLTGWGVWAFGGFMQDKVSKFVSGPKWRWLFSLFLIFLLFLCGEELVVVFAIPSTFSNIHFAAFAVSRLLMVVGLIAVLRFILLSKELVRWVTVGIAYVVAVSFSATLETSFLDKFQFSLALSETAFKSSQWTMFAVFIVVVGVVTLLIRNYLASAIGRATVAIREDEIAAMNLGIDIFWAKLRNFMFGCALAGLAGALTAHTLPLFRPTDFNLFKSVNVLLMVVLGGMGSITGSYIGAIVLTILPEGLRFLEQWRLVIYSLVLILFMIFRPGGLLGSREIGELLRNRFWPRPPAVPKADPEPEVVASA